MIEKKIIVNERIHEQYIQLTHSSGLQILLYPMAGFSTAYALFGTKYGSVDTTFKTDKEDAFSTVPEGIAHYLEHKLFESEDGDAFSLFAKTGANANAFTSFDKTCYLFSTTDHFEESLKALISFVQHPYFTEENVEKERGIIGQEIRMYQDNPGWRVMFNMLCGMYEENPVRVDIAGTIDSIAQIDRDLLYRCYNTFYNLGNMAVAIAGNFDPDRAAQIIEEELLPSQKVTVETKVNEESAAVKERYVEQRLSVSMPLFNFGYKEPAVAPKEQAITAAKFEIILNVLAGESSDLYHELYDAGLIDNGFASEVFMGKGYFTCIFEGESRNPQLVSEKIIQAANVLKEKGIAKEDYERVKKAIYGKCVAMFSNVEEVAHSLISAHFSDVTLYEALEAAAAVTLEEVNQTMKTALDERYTTLSVILPLA